MNSVHAFVSSDKGFYIGDVCYVLSDKVYRDFWGVKKKFADGCFEVPGTDELNFAVASTAFGDGEYEDDFGHSYPVDAGVIGLVPLELVKNRIKAEECGVVIEEPGEALFYAVDGVFTITLPRNETYIIDTHDWGDDDGDDGSVFISVGWDDDDDDYDDDEDEEDYDEDDDF